MRAFSRKDGFENVAVSPRRGQNKVFLKEVGYENSITSPHMSKQGIFRKGWI
jgi:hypothetical protein